MPGTLLIGDVHGCAQELDLLLRLVLPSRVVLLGDLFAKGPDPAGVWELIDDWHAESVLGNHDQAVLDHPDRYPDVPRAAVDWIATLPLWIEGDGWIAVHAAIHPKGLHKTSRKVATGLKEPKGGAWWKRWRGPPLVVHGHDSSRGLVDRRPHALGLDTGCVRGRQLTGWHAEKNRLISVPSLQVPR